MADTIVPPAAVTAKTDKIIEVNPKITEVHLKIKNSDILAKLAEKYKATGIKEELGKTRAQNDWFQRIDLSNNAESAGSIEHIIDVQPDFRFPFSYFVYYITKIFPALDLKSTPSTSIYTLLAYFTIAFNAFLLLNEELCRPFKSIWAQHYANDHERRDYFRILQTMHVPIEIAQLFENFAAVLDPAKPNCYFVPSLAGSAFLHDFGRMMPPHLFLAMHNTLYNVRNNIPVEEVLRLFYNTHLFTIANVEYRVSNFIGGFFLHQQENCAYTHWIKDLCEAIFSPAVGRALIQRPTLAPVKITTIQYNGEPNPYDIMCAFSSIDYNSRRSMILANDAFIATNKEMPSVELASILVKTGGISTLTHTIETMTLPTWHNLTPPSKLITKPNEVKEKSSTEISTIGNFLNAAPEFNGKIPYPTLTDKDWNAKLYLVTNKAYNHLTAPIQYDLFDEDNHLHPDVFIFQPYERNLNRANIAMTLGLKIQADEIDAAIIPLPNSHDSLYDNNSCFLVGSIPLTTIKPVSLTETEANGTKIIERHDKSHEINGLAIRDGGANILPYFGNEQQAQAGLPPFFQLEDNHNNPSVAATYTAWRETSSCRLPAASRAVWSSYRYVKNSNRASREISF
jgi:hypothetical protein